MSPFRSWSRLGYLPSTTAAIRVDRGGTRRFYSRRLRTVQMVIALFLTFALAVGPTSEWAAGDSNAYRTSSATVLVVGLIVSWRLLRRGLLVEPDRIVIRNMLSFRRVPLDEVVRFSASPRYGGMVRPGLRISLRSGRTLYANAFPNTRVDANDVGSREAAELNAHLASRRRSGNRVEPVVPEWQVLGNPWAYRAWLLVPTLLLVALLILLVATVLNPEAVDV